MKDIVDKAVFLAFTNILMFGTLYFIVWFAKLLFPLAYSVPLLYLIYALIVEQVLLGLFVYPVIFARWDIAQ